MSDPVDRPPRRLPWWLIGGVVLLAVLGAVWLVKLILGLVWLLVQIAVIAAVVLVVFGVLRARSRRRSRQMRA